MRLQQTISAHLEAISHFNQQLESALSSLSVHDRTTVVLAVQELLVNIVRHAYAGESGDIDFEMTLAGAQLNITVRDYANIDFEMPERIDPIDVLSLPESGMGLYIIQQAFDDIEYQIIAGGHLWLLRKRLEG